MPPKPSLTEASRAAVLSFLNELLRCKETNNQWGITPRELRTPSPDTVTAALTQAQAEQERHQPTVASHGHCDYSITDADLHAFHLYTIKQTRSARQRHRGEKPYPLSRIFSSHVTVSMTPGKKLVFLGIGKKGSRAFERDWCSPSLRLLTSGPVLIWNLIFCWKNALRCSLIEM